MGEGRRYFAVFDRDRCWRRCLKKTVAEAASCTRVVLVADGGLRRAVPPSADPIADWIDLMSTIEAICPQWPAREVPPGLGYRLSCRRLRPGSEFYVEPGSYLSTSPSRRRNSRSLMGREIRSCTTGRNGHNICRRPAVTAPACSRC